MFHQIIALIWGIVVGFAIAVPIGPVGIIVVQRTIMKNRLIGLVTGLGAALTDGFLASVGAFGIKAISEFIFQEQTLLHLIGGSILFIIGLIAVFSKPKQNIKKPDSAITIIEHFFSGAILTATNPIAAASFFLAFANIGPRIGIGGPGIATYLVIGVVIGSCLWWLLLTHIAVILGHRIKPEHIDNINRWLGVVIAVLGGIVLIGSVLK